MRDLRETRFTATIEGVDVTIEASQLLNQRDNIRPNAVKPRAFVSIAGESVMENLVNRRNRPVKLYRKIAELAIESLYAAGPTRDNISLRWSQKAGCSCPCSPGFVITGIAGQGDIFITVSPVTSTEVVHTEPTAEPTVEVVATVREEQTTHGCTGCGATDYEGTVALANQGYSACCNEPVGQLELAPLRF